MRLIREPGKFEHELWVTRWLWEQHHTDADINDTAYLHQFNPGQFDNEPDLTEEEREFLSKQVGVIFETADIENEPMVIGYYYDTQDTLYQEWGYQCE